MKWSYHLGASGYSIPPDLEAEVSYAESQRKNAYYRAAVGDDGRLAGLAKYLLDRDPVTRPIVGLDKLSRAKSDARYFSFEEREGSIAIVAELSLPETEPLGAYLVLSTKEDGAVVSAKRVTKKPFFEHTYSYWDTGEVKVYTTRDRDGAVVTRNLDRDGNEAA